MRYLLIIAGVIIVGFTIVDLIWTSLWVDGGAGPLTDRMTNIAWKLLKKADRKIKNILNLSGPFLLIGTLATWMMLFWIGWTLIFAGSEGILRTSGNEPVQWHDYLYYSAYVIFTLGNGEFYPIGAVWQIVTSLATGFGMMFLTLGTSYILSIIGAVIRKRAFASSVFGIGKSAEEIIINAWDGNDFYKMDLYLNDLSTELSILTYQHKAYPLLFYYHTSSRIQALSVAVPIIDDVLSFFDYGLTDEVKINMLLVRSLRSSIDEYLETLEKIFIEFEDRALYLPDINNISYAGIPTVEEGEFRKKMEEIEGRRQMLYGLMVADNRRKTDGSAHPMN